MKFYPSTDTIQPPQFLLLDLEDRREADPFRSADYLASKQKLFQSYLQTHQISTVIVAISGGIDSALVLAMLKHFQLKIPFKLLAFTIPSFSSEGVTRQPKTVDLAGHLSQHFQLTIPTLDLSPISNLLEEICEQAIGKPKTAWAAGQAIPYLRTALLYSLTAYSSEQNGRTLLVGTTNKDEGAYLGYFGKASDGLVDIQLISDLHKSQVFELANFLSVPATILTQTPTGDMYDSRVDEDVFGAPYSVVEWGIRALHQSSHQSIEAAYASTFCLHSHETDFQTGLEMCKNLDELHRHNQHKYFGGSPAIHMDLSPFLHPKGWNTHQTWDYPKETPIQKQNWHNPVESFNDTFSLNPSAELICLTPGIWKWKNLISKEACEKVREWAKNLNWQAANQHGRPLSNGDSVASFRATSQQKQMSEQLFKILLKHPHFSTQYSRISPLQSDLSEGRDDWTLDGFSEVWRWISYPHEGLLVPHYDNTFIHHSHRRTLLSVVSYWTEGTTRFLVENRPAHFFEDMDEPNSASSFLDVSCEPGDILMFDHRFLHDAPSHCHEKLISRTDLIFKRPFLGKIA